MSIHEIFMKRPDEPVALIGFPEGFSMRPYRRGDEENWFHIYQNTDQLNKVYSSMFKEYFGADQWLLNQRQFYLCDENDEPIGTATAWFNKSYHGDMIGRLHWVAILREYQGMGLAKPMISYVLRKAQDLGHREMYLRTYSLRIHAICLYWFFGFRPELRNAHDWDVWKEMAEENSLTDILEYLDEVKK